MVQWLKSQQIVIVGGIGISTTNFGTGYDFASVAVSGGSPDSAAIIRPIISTANGGFGKDPVKDLRSNALMFNAKPSGAEGKTSL